MSFVVLESQKISGCLVAYFVSGNLLSNNLNTGGKLRLTRRLRRIHNAWRFQFKLNLVFKVQWVRYGGWRCSPLNAALVVAGNLELMYKAIPITIGVKLHEFSCTSGDSR